MCRRVAGFTFLLLLWVSSAYALPPTARHAPAPENQSESSAEKKSAGCVSCHTATDRKTMHANPAVVLGCTDCHGGDATVAASSEKLLPIPEYRAIRDRAHVLPRFPSAWGLDTGGQGERDIPVRTYTLANRESPEFIRFRNPGDLRIARDACGACHGEIVEASSRSLMATAAMFWTAAGYNNGIVERKRPFLGEAYTRSGHPATIQTPDDFEWTELHDSLSAIRSVSPLPRWETTPPGDNFRVFERGGRNISNLFPEVGLPNLAEEPGRPDIRQSNRGAGTGARISVPVLNLHKTRLNDPLLWFDGTMDNPGDFRSAGCSACHVIYANDRDPISSGIYARYGHWGQSVTVDPTIAKRVDEHGEPEKGHPIRHEFTRAIPTSQCMTCHLHQPNMFLNSYLGYTMWDYEADAPLMWPKEQQYPSSDELFAIWDRNPEGASPLGRWSDLKFLSRVWDDVNPVAKDTQFSDYHGHGWNFRAVFRRARDGSLLDADGEHIPDDLDPSDKWKRAVHLRDIHADGGMQCADCHYAQDSHGGALMVGEVAAAVEIRCRDCHGTTTARSTLRTSGPAAPPGGHDLSLLRNEDGRSRFVWRGENLVQRLILPPHEERKVPQVIHSIDPAHVDFNSSAAHAKMVRRIDANSSEDGSSSIAHADDKVACFSCHSSWMTSCAGCHLPVQANAMTEVHHFEGGETRNFATYNPQVARDQMFQLGIHGDAKGGIISPVRSSSALVLSSSDANRNRIYVQQPPISSGGFSSQAFAPHFPHTVRRTETKRCPDCHVSEDGDNNAIMAQLLLLGTRFVDFVGFHLWVGGESAVTAVQVTEWEEPQAVIGSYLHQYAFPDFFREHQERELELTRLPAGALDADPGWVESVRRFFQGDFGGRSLLDGTWGHDSGPARCLQLRGEYLYVAEGSRGTQVYDVASIGNKGISERLISAPFSPLGQDVRIASPNATCIALPTNQPIRPDWNRRNVDRPENREQVMHPVYSYLAITDSIDGLILANVETLADGEPRNNFLERAITWNPEGWLDGARHAWFAGHFLYVSADRGVVVVDLDEPLSPKVAAVIALDQPRATMVQFRYLFAVDEKGFRVVDVTDPRKPQIVERATVPLTQANNLFVSRTYAYVAAGDEGLVIVDIERPESPRVHLRTTAKGKIHDARDVVVATTNASLFAYVADGEGGIKVLQLTSPDLQPKFYGFSPAPNPKLVAWRKLSSPALSLSRPLERDRAVDETGHQIAVFGRIGSRPFSRKEMESLFLRDGKVWTVKNEDK